MSLRTEQVEEYTVVELTIGQVMDLQEASEGLSGKERTLAMLGASVQKDGQPLGSTAAQLPARLAKRLTKLVTEMNGLNEEDEENPNG